MPDTEVKAAVAAASVAGPLPFKRHALSGSVERRFAVALHLGGWSLRRIAERLDRAPTAIRRWVRAAGIDTAGIGDERRRAIRVHVDVPRLYRLRVTEGLPWAQVCRALGYDESARRLLLWHLHTYASVEGLTIPNARHNRARPLAAARVSS